MIRHICCCLRSLYIRDFIYLYEAQTVKAGYVSHPCV